MTTELTATTTHRAALSTKNKVGLAIAAVLGLADVVGMLAGAPSADPGEQGPPTAVLVAAGILGIISLAAAAYAWRTGNRVGSRIVAGARILSAVLSLPAFFVADVPPGLVAVAAGGIVITILTVWLVLSPPKAG